MFKGTVAVVGLFLLACVGAGPAPHGLLRDALVGKWKVTVSPDEDSRHDKAKEFSDTLTFKGGTFKSEELAKHGFEAGPYDEDTRPGAVGAFNAILKSKKEDQGKARWSGFVTATSMQGDMVWTKKDGTTWTYTFNGEKE